MMKFINVMATEEVGGDARKHGLYALYDDTEGRHEMVVEGATEKECLLNLLDMVAKIAQNQD